MAFPQVDYTQSSSTSPPSTTHTVTLPTSATGKLLVMFLSIGHGSNNSIISSGPSGWDYIASGGSNPYHVVYIYAKKDSGSEGSSVNFSTINSTYSSHLVFSVSGWKGDAIITNNVKASNRSSGSSNSPNPASLTPSWGSADTLWIAFTGHAPDNIPVANYPTNYSDNNQSVGDGSYSALGVATRELAATSEDPGVFTLPESEDWETYTVGIEPAELSGIQINIGDAWKKVPAMQINIGDAWKEVVGAQINVGDAWKTMW